MPGLAEPWVHSLLRCLPVAYDLLHLYAGIYEQKADILIFMQADNRMACPFVPLLRCLKQTWELLLASIGHTMAHDFSARFGKKHL